MYFTKKSLNINSNPPPPHLSPFPNFNSRIVKILFEQKVVEKKYLRSAVQEQGPFAQVFAGQHQCHTDYTIAAKNNTTLLDQV